MGNITKFSLNLPPVGYSGNWGSIVNQNFIKVADEIQKIYQAINSAQSLIGANIPYINVDKEKHYFVEVYHKAGVKFTPGPNTISGPENGSLEHVDCILKFYGEVKNGSVTSLQQTQTYYYYTESDNEHALGWNPILPMYIASYVMGVYAFDKEGNTQDMLEAKIKQTSTLMPSWDKSDILVVVPEFGSIYGDNYTISFKKYLPIGDYYKPVLATIPYRLEFIKTDFVSWYQEQPALDYTLPAVGLGIFNSFSVTRNASNEYSSTVGTVEGDIWQFTVTPARPNNATEASQIAPKFNWYIKKRESIPDSENGSSGSISVIKFQPVFIAYDYYYKETESEGKKQIEYTIQVDVSNLEQDEELYGEMYFNFKDGFVAYPGVSISYNPA